LPRPTVLGVVKFNSDVSRSMALLLLVSIEPVFYCLYCIVWALPF